MIVSLPGFYVHALHSYEIMGLLDDLEISPAIIGSGDNIGEYFSQRIAVGWQPAHYYNLTASMETSQKRKAHFSRQLCGSRCFDSYLFGNLVFGSLLLGFYIESRIFGNRIFRGSLSAASFIAAGFV